jgi:uncharacterized protein YcbX
MAVPNTAGSVISLWRFPVKSMMGEELGTAVVTERGLLGDRAYGLVDPSDGRLVSAKEPRKWPNMFEFRATFLEQPQEGAQPPPVRITLPDGSEVASDAKDLDRALSDALGRAVIFTAVAPAAPTLEEYWPDIEGLAHRDAVTDEATLAGTFFDGAMVHLLTTATVDQLHALYPDGHFDERRFRPNIVVETPVRETGFAENGWVGRTLAIGRDVRLSVTGSCPRCGMTILSQGDLPKDPGILRTAVKHNEANVGVYAAVARGGVIGLGDSVRLE